MTESDRIITEVLRLDAEATKGPWTVDTKAGMSFIREIDSGQGRSTVFDDDDGRNGTNNAALIASYRTAAPRLARMLKMHQDLASGIANGTQPPWLDEVKKLEEIRPYEPIESKAARYVLNKCDEIEKGEA